jgi:outer membrane protein TolC
VNRNIQTVAKTAVSLVISAILVACAVGPNYNKPKVELAPFHNNPASGHESQASLDQWWTGFDDPMLTEVIQRALSQNLDLAAAIARVQQARAAAAGAGAALLPSADLNASATYERQSTRGAFGSVASTLPGYSRGIHDYSVGPAASWEVDLFGGLRREAGTDRRRRTPASPGP